MDATPDQNGAGSVESIISGVAARYHIPAYIPLDIARFESGLNPRNVGDHGTSFGLFQLHRGGLAGDVPTSTLFDPITNTQMAISAMLPAYNRGVALGYQGEKLLDYTAVTSAWPGNYGSIERAQQARPDYLAGLHRVYAAHSSEVTHGEIEDGATVTLHDSYATHAATDSVANVFRAIDQKEHIKGFQEWKKDAGITGSINPFSYLFDQGAPLFVRFLLILIALVIVAISLFAIIRPQMEQAAQGVAAAETGGAIIV